MFERIIVPLDPAKRLHAAKEYGIGLAGLFDSTVVGTYIIAPTKTGTGAMPVNRDLYMVPAGQREIEAFEAEAAARGVRAEGHIIRGYREQALAEALTKGLGDTLVLGSFRSSLTRFFTGSEDERIVDMCGCPLFVVREAAPLPEAGQVLLVPFDGAAFSAADEAALEALAQRFKARLHLLHFTLKGHRRTDTILEQSHTTFPSRLVAGAQSIQHSHYQHVGPLVERATQSTDSPLVVVPVLSGSNTVSYRLLHDLILHMEGPICLLRGSNELYQAQSVVSAQTLPKATSTA